MPLDIGDFPPIVEMALIIYNKLRDTYIPGDMPHYIGKDLAPITSLFDIYEVNDLEERRFIMDVLSILDHFAIKASRDRIEAANKKIRNKGKSK